MISKRLLISFILTLGVVLPMLVPASPESRELIQQGITDLKEQKFEQALKKFEAAVQTDSADADALFFQGAALNRLGRHGEALAKLAKAQTEGSVNPDLAYELGWSFLGLKLYKEAVVQLEKYEQTNPGRGQTSEFLGRSYLSLGEDKKARAKLNEALQRDPHLKPTVLLYLAMLEKKEKNVQAAGEYLTTLLQESPDSPLSRTLRDQLERIAKKTTPPAEAAADKPWRLSLSMGGGYNSNVIALGEGLSLPSDISGKSAGFGEFIFSASRIWSFTPEDSVTTGYSFQSNVYNAISSSDLLDHYWYADYRHSFTSDLAASFRLSDEFTQVGGDDYRNQPAMRTSATYRWVDSAVVELAHSFALSDHYFPTIKAQDRDGESHTISLTNYFTVPNTQLQARLGYFSVLNDSDGGDFDYSTYGFIVGATYPLLWEVTGSLSYVHTYDQYDNSNSLAGSGFSFPRDDQVDTVNINLSRPIFDWMRAYTRFTYTDADSNIRFFNYSQQIWSAGVVMQF